MFVKNQNIQIILRALLLLMFSSCIFPAYFVMENLALGLLLVCCAMLSIVSLVRYINKTNRQLSFFFDAVENNDSSISFPDQDGQGSMGILYKSLNALNGKLQAARMIAGQKEQYLHAVIEQSANAVLTFDAEGRIELMNSAAKKLFNTGAVQNISKFENEAVSELFLSVSERRADTVAMKICGQVKYIKYNCAELAFQGKRVYLFTANDIRHDMEAKELDSWVKLIRILTHEIMNSIAPVTSIAGTLRGYFSNPNFEPTKEICTDTADGLEVIEEQGKRLSHFVDSYRALSRLPDPVLGDVAVEPLFDKVKYLFAEKAKAQGARIAISVSPYDLIVRADENLLNHVLVNLVKNALQATESTPDGQISLDARRNVYGSVVLSVSDNGCGISPEEAERVFIPFFTTKEDGSGIGLSLARQIMHAHNGSIELQSINGSTQFLLLL